MFFTAQGGKKKSISIDLHKVLFKGQKVLKVKTTYADGDSHHYDYIPDGDIYKAFKNYRKNRVMEVESYKKKFRDILESGNNKKLLSSLYETEVSPEIRFFGF